MPIVERRISQINNPIDETFNLVRGRNGSNSSQPPTSNANNNNNQACYSCCGGSSRKANQGKEFSFENTASFSPQRQVAFPESTAAGTNTQKEIGRNSSKCCKTCSLSILDTSPVIQSGSNVFHTNCIKCGGCSKIMIDSHFIEDDEKICCFDCFNRIKCSVCNVELKEDYILSNKRGFHQDCFGIKIAKTTVAQGPKTVAQGPKQMTTPNIEIRSKTWDIVYMLSFLMIFLSLYKFHRDLNIVV